LAAHGAGAATGRTDAAYRSALAVFAPAARIPPSVLVRADEVIE
jgi:hypothetical protein